MDGLSRHYYTVKTWNGSKGYVIDSSSDDYDWTLRKCHEFEDVIQKHIVIMDKYDTDKRIGFMVDEWGVWWNVEHGTNPGFLFQQNTMRDAMVAGLTSNVFHKYADRIQMSNIAQIVNVLQYMILTKEDKMILMMTYFVFKMYQVHQDAPYLPSEITEKMFRLPPIKKKGRYIFSSSIRVWNRIRALKFFIYG
jgi:alpha-N-arabinofuranosidase